MIGDKNEMDRKLKQLSKAVRKFQGTSYRALDAAFALQKNAAGTEANRKAQARWETADAAFQAADQSLTALLMEYGE
jgi:hypothetical protein